MNSILYKLYIMCIEYNFTLYTSSSYSLSNVVDGLLLYFLYAKGFLIDTSTVPL